MLTEEWFVARSFKGEDFCDSRELSRLKRERDVSVTLILPTRNVGKTIGPILDAVARHEQCGSRICDQVIVVDSSSDDGTLAVARGYEVEIYPEGELMPEFGQVYGKGDAMWRALSKAHGDLVVFADTDTCNFTDCLVYSVVGCLLKRPEIRFAKAAYRRPFHAAHSVIPNGGGRVTELMAKPLISAFFPELSGFAQPLAGEFGATRSVLWSTPFLTGYAVDVGLLIDVFVEYGLASMAQIELDARVNRHQDLSALSRMAYSILRGIVARSQFHGRATWTRETPSPDPLAPMSAYHHAGFGPSGLTLDRFEEFLFERPPMRLALADRTKA